MSVTKELSSALREWAEIFMRQSMKDFIVYARNLELSLAQIGVLIHLYYSGNSSISDIAKKMGVSNSASSQLIRQLEKRNLIERREGMTDRRIRKIELTDDGINIAETIVKTRFAWLNDLAASIKPEQSHRISIALNELSEAALAASQSDTNYSEANGIT